MRDETRALLQEDPGNPAFVDFAEELRRAGELREAMEICLAGLSANPSSLRGRLVLARIFYESGYSPFAAREIAELQRARPESESLRKLAMQLGSEISQAEPPLEQSEVVAEGEFNLDVLETLIEEKKNN